MMLKLSVNAQKSFNDYLNQVKLSLRGVKSVDAEEIVQNVNEHIENELSDRTEPVGFEELDEVLKKLGSPQQWVPEEEISWWRKFILRIRTGPEDWRLAYLSFGLLLPGFLFPPAFLVLVPASYLISRAAMSLSGYNIQVSAQKWLVYPSLIVITLLIAGVLLLAPLLVLIPMAVHLEEGIMETHNIEIDDHYGILAASLIGMLTCLWCMLEGIICLIFPALPKKLLYPMADWFKRKHAVVLIVLAFVVFSLFLILWIYSLNTYVY